MQQTQTPLLDLLIDDSRPVHEWADVSFATPRREGISIAW